ncbi:MAG TPA: hypothetical protein VHU91_08005 [Mycobacteriales bacterium]|nr:hypothetical protein [Mycobacteriales bacterium]
MTVGDGENPPEVMEFDHEADGGTWYAEYRRMGQDDAGWHYGATGNAERADEE